MMLLQPVLAEAGAQKFEPLFGSQWLALLAILAGIAVLLLAVAAVGRWLAATHSSAPTAPATATPVVAPSAEVFAAIAAAVAVTFGSKARIASVQPDDSTEISIIDPSRQQWSIEGRRQIYSSHKVR